MMKLKINLIVLLASAFLFSCDTDGYADYDAGKTQTQELSGQWYVSVYSEDGQPLTGYALLTTYNTAANDNTIFVDDDHNFFPLKVKATASVEELSFSADNSVNLYDAEGAATITEGKVIPNGTKASGSRNVVDSLSFKVQLANDPDNLYLVAGYRDTGFYEDEH